MSTGNALYRIIFFRQLYGLLQEGKIDEAIRFVDSPSIDLSFWRGAALLKKGETIGLWYWEKDRIITGLREMARQQEARRRQAEVWVRELSQLLNEKKYRKARKYVESLPIEKQAKENILAQLPKPSWF